MVHVYYPRIVKREPLKPVDDIKMLLPLMIKGMRCGNITISLPTGSSLTSQSMEDWYFGLLIGAIFCH